MTEAKTEAPRDVVVTGRPVGEAGQLPETKPYKLRPGYRHFQDGRVVQGGEEVQLTEAQAKAFSDKFQAIDPPKMGSGPGEVYEPKPEPAVRTETSHVPQDIGAKTRDPNAPDQNPGNAVPITTPTGQLRPALPGSIPVPVGVSPVATGAREPADSPVKTPPGQPQAQPPVTPVQQTPPPAEGQKAEEVKK